MPNPRTKEFSLKHRIGYHFSLQEHEASHVHHSTMLPLFVADQAKTETLAQDLQVHPANDLFEGIVNTPMCFMNSRINKVRIAEYCMIPPPIDVPDAIYWKAVLSFGLGDVDILAADGTSLISILGFTKLADNILPTYVAGTDMEHANLLHADVDNLDTTQSLEGVALQPSQLFDARYGELGPKIRSMVDGPFINRVHKDYPYWVDRWYNVPGRVKRMNAFSGCFLYVGLNPTMADAATAASSDRIVSHFDDDLTIEEESLNCHLVVEYNEYNDSFDQSA